MAYVIHVDNQLIKIAANENEKNDLNIFFPPAVAIDISEADFLKLKKNKVVATISEGTVNFTECSNSFETAEDLKEFLDNNIKKSSKDFLDASNSHKILHSTINTYYNTLNSFDTSIITFPLNKSWEEYCEENSITYVHALQIP